MSVTVFIIALLCGVVASVSGGILGGILIGKQLLGRELASWLGGLFGIVGGTGGIILGLVAIAGSRFILGSIIL